MRAPNLLLALGAIHGRPQGAQNGHLPTLEIGSKNQNFLENMQSAAQFRLIDLILAMTVYLPVRHSHCRRVSSLVSAPLRAKLGSGFFMLILAIERRYFGFLADSAAR